MNKIVCIDSNICVWGIKKDGDPNKIPIATRFLEHLEEQKIKILLPTPVIVEILSHIKEESQRATILNLIQNNRVIVKPLDIVAALKCAQLLHRTLSEQDIRDGLKNGMVNKTKLKYDCQICAIAIINKCDCIYTDNINDFERYAHGEIRISNMQVFPVQQNIFTSSGQINKDLFPDIEDNPF